MRIHIDKKRCDTYSVNQIDSISGAVTVEGMKLGFSISHVKGIAAWVSRTEMVKTQRFIFFWLEILLIVYILNLSPLFSLQ